MLATRVDTRRFLLPALVLAVASAIAAGFGLEARHERTPPPIACSYSVPVHRQPAPVEVQVHTQLEPWSNLPRSCQRYMRVLEGLARCEAFPADSRKAIADAVRTTADAWRSIPAEAMAPVESACSQATDAVKQATSSMCPDLAQL